MAVVRLKVEDKLKKVREHMRKLSKFKVKELMRKCANEVYNLNNETLRAHKTPTGRPWKLKKTGGVALTEVRIDVTHSTRDFRIIVNATKNGRSYGLYHQMGARLPAKRKSYVFARGRRDIVLKGEKTKRLPKRSLIPNRKTFPAKWLKIIMKNMEMSI